MSDFELEVKNAEKIAAALSRFPTILQQNMTAAGNEAGNEIVNTRGLKLYPKETGANKPPTPYYIRGRGTQTASGNLLNSERYGTQFYVKTTYANRGTETAIGNRASYAKYLAGEDDQAIWAMMYGWERLIDVAKGKIGTIRKIFRDWLDKSIKDAGL